MSNVLAVTSYLPAEEFYRRYRQADRPNERARWHMLWLKASSPLGCQGQRRYRLLGALWGDGHPPLQ
jgi:hypothetical protein